MRAVVLERLADAWREDRSRIEESGAERQYGLFVEEGRVEGGVPVGA